MFGRLSMNFTTRMSAKRAAIKETNESSSKKAGQPLKEEYTKGYLGEEDDEPANTLLKERDLPFRSIFGGGIDDDGVIVSQKP